MASDKILVTSIRLSPATKKRIDLLAATTGRSRSYLLAEAVERYIEYETWFATKVEESLQDETDHGHEPGYYMTSDELLSDFVARGIISAEQLTETQNQEKTA